MIKRLSIKNFKSIKNLQLECRRMNIFIGDPNTGKSNILESLSLIPYNNGRLKDFIRLNSISQLFFDYDTISAIEIKADDLLVSAEIRDDLLVVDAHFKVLDPNFNPFTSKYSMQGDFKSGNSNDGIKNLPQIRSYRFNPEVVFQKSEVSHLNTPFGTNLAAVIFSKRDLRIQIQNLLEGLGYKLLFKPNENDLEIYKEQEGYSISFPYLLVSDTVKKMIFYLTAIESNTNSTIVLEEPESNTFPLYIKYLAEKVAAFNQNQFFITTHNPYFLTTVIEKTFSDDLAVNLVESEDGDTKITQLRRSGIEKILNLTSDVFLNFDFLKE